MPTKAGLQRLLLVTRRPTGTNCTYCNLVYSSSGKSNLLSCRLLERGPTWAMHCAFGLQGDLYQVWPGIGFELLVKLLCLPLHFNIFDLSRRIQEHVGLRQGHFAKVVIAEPLRIILSSAGISPLLCRTPRRYLPCYRPWPGAL